MTEEQKLSKIALKEAVKFINNKIKSKSGGNYSAEDVINFAKTFYSFLK